MRTASEQIVLLIGGSIHDSKEESQLVDRDFDVLTPDEFDIRIEEAVLSLTGAVFSRGWRLEFRHDPVFTPLAVEAVLDYWQPLPGEETNPERRRSGTPLVIFVSELDHDVREQMEYAIRIGCVSLTHEDEIDYEKLSRAVCVGGATETRKQISTIREQGPQVPIFTIPSTGGVAQALADTPGIANPELGMVREIVERRSAVRFEPPEARRTSDSEKRFCGQGLDHERIPQFRYALYPILMDMILESDERSGSAPLARPIKPQR
jgi:hypothetical protein